MARIPVAQRRQDLVDAAFRVMSRDGVAAASTRAICNEAGVAQSLFHYCFQSKEDLFRQLTKTVVAEMGTRLPSTRGSDLESSLAHAFDHLLNSAMRAPDQQLVLYELTATVLRDPELAELARWQYNQYYEAVGVRIAELPRRFHFRWSVPIDTVVRLFTTVIDGAILGWLADHDTERASATLQVAAQQIAALVADDSAPS